MNQRIIYATTDGVAIIIPAECGLTIEEIAEKNVPPDVPFEIIDVSEIPQDRTFRGAWEMSGKAIVHNIERCKDLAHGKRRALRAAEFAPLDIEATIPAKAALAEAAREAVRQKYATMQSAIDAAENPEALKALISP